MNPLIPLKSTLKKKAREKKDVCKQKLNILLLDTPQVHYTLRLLRNFEIRTGINTAVTLLPHHLLYDTILKTHYIKDEEPFDVIMYDIPWMPFLASEHILSDISDNMRSIDTTIFSQIVLNITVYLTDAFMAFLLCMHHRYYSIARIFLKLLP